MGNERNKKKNPLSVCLVQMHSLWQDSGTNQQQIERSFRESRAELTVFPEACSSGFDYERLPDIARSNVELLARMQSACQKNARACLLPLLYADGGRIVNRSFFLAADGQINGCYDKIHLIPALQEDRYLQRGHQVVQIRWQGWRLALATCYDLRFAEFFSKLNVGADLIAVVAMWPLARKKHLLTLARARSIESQTPLLLCNATGETGGIEYAGSSRIYNARGEILARAGNEEGMVEATLDANHTDTWRTDFPMRRILN